MNFLHIRGLIPTLILIGLITTQLTIGWCNGFWLAFAFMAFLASFNPKADTSPLFLNIVTLLCPIAYILPILMFVYLVLFLIVMAMAGARSDAQYQADEDYTHKQKMLREQEKQTKLLEEQNRQLQQNQFNNMSDYGVQKPTLPIGGCKLCRVFVINHDGTSATFHQIGLEHELRKMYEYDPRFKSVQISVDSLNEYGHYGFI